LPFPALLCIRIREAEGDRVRQGVIFGGEPFEDKGLELIARKLAH